MKMGNGAEAVPFFVRRESAKRMERIQKQTKYTWILHKNYQPG